MGTSFATHWQENISRARVNSSGVRIKGYNLQFHTRSDGPWLSDQNRNQFRFTSPFHELNRFAAVIIWLFSKVLTFRYLFALIPRLVVIVVRSFLGEPYEFLALLKAKTVQHYIIAITIKKRTWILSPYIRIHKPYNSGLVHDRFIHHPASVNINS